MMKPKFYSKEAVSLLMIMSPILGCILFSHNLKEVGKGRFSPYFIVAGLVWIIITKRLLAGIINDSLSQLLFSGIAGCLIMTFFIWDKFLNNYPVYEKKTVWKPVLIFISICTALLLFQLLSVRK